MRTISKLLLVAALLACGVDRLAADVPLLPKSSGGAYSVFWHSGDGGSARSSAGPYSLFGIFGQPDPGQAAAGSYLLRGGFLPSKAAPPDDLFRNGFE